jgi:choline monooxygenase
MTTTDHGPQTVPPPYDEGLTRRGLAVAETGTTEMAESVLRVPLAYYRDPAVLERERTLLATTPLALVASAEVAHPHDYLVRSAMGTSVLVSRDGDGLVRAFLNYCRHRGAKPAEGCGNARRFACPYHAWTYDSGGQLVGLPGQDGFPDIDRSAYGLVELPSEERHGFVWVVLTVGAPIDVAAHLGPLDDELGGWGYERFEPLTHRDFEAAVNWKAALEAFAEGYHFPYVHGNSLVGQNTMANTGIHDAFGRHHRLGLALQWITSLDRADPASWEPLNNLAVIYWIYPNLVLANSPVGLEIIGILPGDSPTSCSVRHGWMATHPAGDDATRAGYWQLYEAVHAAVRDEDFGMLPSCGEAIRHGQHDHMLIGRNEIGVQHVVRTFASELGFVLD